VSGTPLPRGRTSAHGRPGGGASRSACGRRAWPPCSPPQLPRRPSSMS